MFFQQCKNLMMVNRKVKSDKYYTILNQTKYLRFASAIGDSLFSPCRDLVTERGCSMSRLLRSNFRLRSIGFFSWSVDVVKPLSKNTERNTYQENSSI